MTQFNLSTLPNIQLIDNEPVFKEPWEAQAFAMVVNLHQNSAFDWDEWASFLSSEIHSGEDRSYYQHWLAALEKIVAWKELTSEDDLQSRKEAWHIAAAVTPHGQPIVLNKNKNC